MELYSGGDTGTLLHDISGYVKGTVRDATSIRLCGGAFIKEVTGLKIGKTVLPHVCTAVMVAQLTCPAIKVVNGVCGLIPAMYLKKLVSSSRADKTLHAEMLIKEAKKLIVGIAIDNARKVKLVGTFAARLVVHIMGIGRDSHDKKDWESMKEISEVALYVFNLTLTSHIQKSLCGYCPNHNRTHRLMCVVFFELQLAWVSTYSVC